MREADHTDTLNQRNTTILLWGSQPDTIILRLARGNATATLKKKVDDYGGKDIEALPV